MPDAPVGSAAALLGAGEGNPGATGTTTTVTPAAVPGATAASTSPAWTEGWAAEDAGYVEKKGWRAPTDLFKSYRELEGKLGADKVVLPKDANDAQGWDTVYNRLGRPESADKYQFPEGVDANTVKSLAPELHKMGISQRQAEALAKLDLQRAQSAQAMQAEKWNADQAQAVEKLNREWGADAPKNIELNRRAMRALGLSVDEATNYMNGGGSEKFLRLLNMVGKAIGEDNSGSLESESGLGFGMTPNRAAAELQALKANPEFMKRWGNGDPHARAQYDQLLKQTQGARRTVGGAIK